MFWLTDVFTGTDSARAMRSYETRARAARAGLARRMFRTVGRITIGAMHASASRLRTAGRRRALVRATAAMDEHQLNDIGLTPDDVELLNRGEWPARLLDHGDAPAPAGPAKPASGVSVAHRDDRQERDWRRAA